MDNEVSVISVIAIKEFLKKYKKEKRKTETKDDIINYILNNIDKLAASSIECDNCKSDNYFYDW
jgi:hypothetical protein